MKCPICDTKYICTCKSCTEHTPSNWERVNMSIDKSSWDEICPTCGKSESIHWWFDESFRQYEVTKIKENVTNESDN